jgi:flagellar biosynthesis protein FlhB
MIYEGRGKKRRDLVYGVIKILFSLKKGSDRQITKVLIRLLILLAYLSDLYLMISSLTQASPRQFLLWIISLFLLLCLLLLVFATAAGKWFPSQ